MSVRRNILLLCMVCQTMLLIQPVCALLPRKVSLDPLLDWTSPFKTEPAKVAEFFGPFMQGERPAFSSRSLNDGVTRQNYDIRGRSEVGDEISFLGGRFIVQNFIASSLNSRIHKYWIGLKSPPGSTTFRLSVEQHISQIMGTQPVDAGSLKFRSGETTPVRRWTNAQFQVFTRSFVNDYVTIEISDPTFKHPSVIPTPAPQATIPSPPPPPVVVDIDLDYLLNFAELWACTPEVFEQKYIAKKEEKSEKPPQFEWLNMTKNRARFSRKLFSDLDIRLTLFGKAIKVEEALVEFVNGRAARVTVSFYNRGDSGEIDVPKFKELFVNVGKNLGQVLKVAPTNQSTINSAALKTVSWQWKSPTGIAMLEHNDYTSGGATGRPEFLRLKLAAPDQADWSMGKLTVGVQRMALVKNITKTPEGDVYISGVPMVDQGTKGYCVAASCQRLFEYMQIPCDQHEIAQLVDADAESGANIFTMQKSLAKIDGQFQVAFKPHINPELYYSGGGKRRISQKQFSIIIKEHADKGVPLLWALELGRYPEVPPLPGDGQISGGHMRLVIGYNSAKSEILFTDSWGAGHELKRMAEAAAYEVTMGLYSMSPRGL